MSNAREQFGGRLVINLKAGTRREMKRRNSKARRREAKRLLEDATTKRAYYRGWAD